MSPTAEPAITSGKTQVLGSITVIDTPLVTRATTSRPNQRTEVIDGNDSSKLAG